MTQHRNIQAIVAPGDRHLVMSLEPYPVVALLKGPLPLVMGVFTALMDDPTQFPLVRQGEPLMGGDHD